MFTDRSGYNIEVEFNNAEEVSKFINAWKENKIIMATIFKFSGYAG